MRYFLCFLGCIIVLISCSKGGGKNTELESLDGTYKFTGSYTKIYDTVTSPGFLVAYENTVTTSNHTGTCTISNGYITTKGLVYDYSKVRLLKETNLSTGAVVNSTLPTINGQIGNISNTITSSYTQLVSTSQLRIDNGNYLFSPDYTVQPADKLYKYSLNNSVLKITYEGYEAPTRMRSIHEAIFIRQ